MEPIRITTPLTPEKARTLKSGDSVLISGVIYTGRDAAHKRLCELLKEGKPLPIDVKNQIIYFVGPSPAKPGMAIGSAGPTTSYRMDAYSPALIEQCIKKAEVVAYEDLQSEAIRRLEVEDLPATVIIDAEGRNLYEWGRADYLKTQE